ncbi:MAG: hypothetical protein RLZZ129_689 [Verrucomicrobiota bacterium]
MGIIGIYTSILKNRMLCLGILLGNTVVTLPAADTPRDLWTSGWFWEASAGVSIVPGGDITLDGINYESDFANGLLIKGAVGKAWTPNWTTTLEWFYRTNSINELVYAHGTITGGDLASTNAFFTVTYALDEGWSWRGVRPYVGLGLGYLQEVDLDLEGYGNEEFSSRGAFAYQWLIGLQRRIGRHGLLFLEGRAIASGKQELASSSLPRFAAIEYDTWSLLTGLRYSF